MAQQRIGGRAAGVLAACALTALAPTSAADGPKEGQRGFVRHSFPTTGLRGLAGDVELYRRSLAIVIGIDKYQALPELSGAVRDATNVAKALTEHGFEVTLLLDGQATKDAIAEALGDSLPNQVEPADRVLGYFAGHGVTVGDGDSAMGYLMPIGGRNDKAVSTGLSMSEMQNWFAGYKAKHVMFVADSCYSGLALNTRGTGLSPKLKDYLKQVTSRPVRLALVAGGRGEEANEWQGQGVFTRYFLQGINGAADSNADGIVTTDELAAYVKPNVSQTAMSQLRAQQNPQVGRRGEGELVFLSQRRTTEPTPAAAAPAGSPGFNLAAVRDLAGRVGATFTAGTEPDWAMKQRPKREGRVVVVGVTTAGPAEPRPWEGALLACILSGLGEYSMTLQATVSSKATIQDGGVSDETSQWSGTTWKAEPAFSLEVELQSSSRPDSRSAGR